MARPSKRTPEREDAIIRALEEGNTRRAAAATVGIDENTFGRWMLRFGGFADRVRKAEATAETLAVGVIHHGMLRGETADAKWWLERRRPDDYGRRDRIELTIRQQAERLAAEFGLDPEALIMEAERIAASA